MTKPKKFRAWYRANPSLPVTIDILNVDLLVEKVNQNAGRNVISKSEVLYYLTGNKKYLNETSSLRSK